MQGLLETGPTPQRGADVIDELVCRYITKQQEEDKLRLRDGDTREGIDRDLAWVKRLGWVWHIGDRDKVAIFEAATWARARRATQSHEGAPDEAMLAEQRMLLRVGESFGREIDRCYWRLDSVPTETLQWLASISSTSPAGVPFGRKTQQSSMARYQSVGHRYLGLCFRAYRLSRRRALAALGLRFTDEQWGLLSDVVHELTHQDECEAQAGPGARCRGEDHLFDSGSDSEGDDDYDEGRGPATPDGSTTGYETDRLDQAVYRFIVASVRQKVGGNVYSSPLLGSCAALGIRRHPLGFCDVHLYTGLLAAIMWWSRIFF